jgi:hypothetical protein
MIKCNSRRFLVGVLVTRGTAAVFMVFQNRLGPVIQHLFFEMVVVLFIQNRSYHSMLSKAQLRATFFAT